MRRDTARIDKEGSKCSDASASDAGGWRERESASTQGAPINSITRAGTRGAGSSPEPAASDSGVTGSSAPAWRFTASSEKLNPGSSSGMVEESVFQIARDWDPRIESAGMIYSGAVSCEVTELISSWPPRYRTSMSLLYAQVGRSKFATRGTRTVQISLIRWKNWIDRSIGLVCRLCRRDKPAQQQSARAPSHSQKTPTLSTSPHTFDHISDTSKSTIMQGLWFTLLCSALDVTSGRSSVNKLCVSDLMAYQQNRLFHKRRDGRNQHVQRKAHHKAAFPQGSQPQSLGQPADA